MTVELEIRHSPGLVDGRRIERTAARAVLPRGDRLLMLRSRHGDYKFPGGGLEDGETAAAALRRELREECGLHRVRAGSLLVRAVEISAAREAGAVFRMTSLYFRVSADTDRAVAPELEDYERDLELTPLWVTPRAARAANRRLLVGADRAVRAGLPWLEREARVLGLLLGGAFAIGPSSSRRGR